MSDYITTAEAARELGVSPRRVLALLHAGRLRGEPVTARMWLIERASLEGARHRPRGRPKNRKKPTKAS